MPRIATASRSTSTASIVRAVAVSQLTQTAENENSPTYLPAGVGDAGGFSVVRTEPDKTQRLWRFDAQGRNPQVVLADVKPVGYHAWVDAQTVALFVLGPPATLRIAQVSSGTAEIVTEGIGRSLHRIPGTRSVSIVQREASGEFWIKQVDVDSKKIEPLDQDAGRRRQQRPRHGVDARRQDDPAVEREPRAGVDARRRGLDRGVRRHRARPRRAVEAGRVAEGGRDRARRLGAEEIATTLRRATVDDVDAIVRILIDTKEASFPDNDRRSRS